jgi:(p)ppGpp synthase/HD superfamily hydrolase
VPYIVHPLAVERTLIECDTPDDVVIAAVLHDVVEDTQVSLNTVRAEFGDRVADLVQAVSERAKNVPWEDRKRETLEMLENAAPEVLWIELADKLDSLRGLRQDEAREGAATWSRFSRGPEQQRVYYQQLSDIFVRRVQEECLAPLAREFQEHVHAVFHT